MPRPMPRAAPVTMATLPETMPAAMPFASSNSFPQFGITSGRDAILAVEASSDGSLSPLGRGVR